MIAAVDWSGQVFGSIRLLRKVTVKGRRGFAYEASCTACGRPFTDPIPATSVRRAKSQCRTLDCAEKSPQIPVGSLGFKEILAELAMGVTVRELITQGNADVERMQKIMAQYASDDLIALVLDGLSEAELRSAIGRVPTAYRRRLSQAYLRALIADDRVSLASLGGK